MEVLLSRQRPNVSLQNHGPEITRFEPLESPSLCNKYLTSPIMFPLLNQTHFFNQKTTKTNQIQISSHTIELFHKAQYWFEKTHPGDSHFGHTQTAVCSLWH